MHTCPRPVNIYIYVYTYRFLDVSHLAAVPVHLPRPCGPSLVKERLCLGDMAKC